MHRQFGKKDVIFIGSLLGLSLLCLWIFSSTKGSSGAWVTVTVNGNVYGTYALAKDQTIQIKNTQGIVTNTLCIKDKKADMTEADCPDKLCVKQKAISADNETIVCLPNRVVVSVTGSKEEGMDGFAQ